MSSLISDDEIHHEVGLVWLEDVTALDYVRQSLDRLPTRRGKPAYHRDGRLVGYAHWDPKRNPPAPVEPSAAASSGPVQAVDV